MQWSIARRVQALAVCAGSAVGQVIWQHLEQHRAKEGEEVEASMQTNERCVRLPDVFKGGKMSLQGDECVGSRDLHDGPMGRLLMYINMTDCGQEKTRRHPSEATADAIREGLLAFSLFFSMPQCVLCGDSLIQPELHSCCQEVDHVDQERG